MLIRQVVILVGGKGTRLGSITAETPKPLLPIQDDKRFLDFLLERLVARGFLDIILVAGHLGERVRERYSGLRIGAASVSVIVEPEPAGTGGALRHAEGRLSDVFVLMNGDSLFDFDAQALATVLRADDAGALALRQVEDGRRFGTVRTANERVLEFTEKDASRTGLATISGGVYLLRRSVLDEIEALPCSIETDIFPKLAARGLLACQVFDGYFIDIGLPDTLDQARREIPALTPVSNLTF